MGSYGFFHGFNHIKLVVELVCKFFEGVFTDNLGFNGVLNFCDSELIHIDGFQI